MGAGGTPRRRGSGRSGTRHLDAQRQVKQVAMGGGSPNFLTETQLERLLAAFRERFTVQADRELSVELDPRTTHREQLDIFLKYGFNRFSLGVQDFSPEVLRRVHRPQTEEDVKWIVDYLRSQGCQEINFDLIYGLPGQTLETCRYTVEQTLQYRPTRIALYHYAHVPWLKPQQKLLEAAGLRQRNLNEFKALEKAKNISLPKRRAASRLALARAFYFIGACLRRKGDARAKGYFEKALRAYPLHLRSWYGFFLR
jgi:coproporphyrinogen III oxidase-like Fe-S oxidoreductase